MREGLALRELARHDWAALPAAGGADSSGVPEYLRGLIEATSADDAELHYWELEGLVVVSGQVFEAGPAVASVLVAALTDGVDERARADVVELLFQLVAGSSHLDAVERGRPHLGDDCREQARQGLWVLYRNYWGACKQTVLEILRRVETDAGRLAALT